MLGIRLGRVSESLVVARLLELVFAAFALALRLAGLDDIRIKLAGLWIDKLLNAGDISEPDDGFYRR